MLNLCTVARNAWALAALLLAMTFAAQAAAAPVSTGHVAIELVPQERAAVPGGTIFVALRQVIEPGWHTYWRNPGDSGLPTKIAWTLPVGWRAGDFVWPVPSRISTGEGAEAILNYVYSGEVLLAVPIEVPATARPGDLVTLKAAVSYLVCKDICVPEDGEVTLSLPVAATSGPHPLWGDAVAKALEAAPKAQGFTAVFQRSASGLRLAVTDPSLRGAMLTGADFFAFSPLAAASKAPLRIERGPEGLTLDLAPGDPAAGAAPETIAGVLVLPGGAYEITAKAGPLPAAASGNGVVAGNPPAKLSLPLAIAFAVLGGLILNLMPCVFPILSMKAAALSGHGQDAEGARLQGIAFFAGVLATFLGLAGLLIAAKAGGAAVGWGFQLQSPAVVASLALIMLAVALNLSGLFEIGASAQGVGADLAGKGGLAGSFFTGVLAVVVAAPCTAPFMATAMGYAFTQPPFVALAVFTGLAVGFAAPFTGLAFAPALITRLPRPGAWMDTLRKVLAFPMYATAAWLVWVLAQQGGSGGLARVLAAAVGLAFAAWMFGRAQTRAAAGARPWFSLIVAGVFAVAAFAGVIWPGYAVPAASSAATPQPAAGGGASLQSVPFSPEKLAALRAEGRVVFVDFTAAWCVTCQVNERSAILRSGVAAAFARTGAVYMVGDWTNRDAVIAGVLAEHGRAGVPLYLVYGKGGREAVVQPQLLTEGMVIRAVEEAAK